MYVCVCAFYMCKNFFIVLMKTKKRYKYSAIKMSWNESIPEENETNIQRVSYSTNEDDEEDLILQKYKNIAHMMMICG